MKVSDLASKVGGALLKTRKSGPTKHRGKKYKIGYTPDGLSYKKYIQDVYEGLTESKELKVQKHKDGFTVNLIVDGNHAGQYTHTRDDDIVRNFAEVFPEYRNKGYGSMLLLATIKTASDLGMDFEEDSISLTPAMSRLYDELDGSGLIYGSGGAWTISPNGENELEDWLTESKSLGLEEGLDDLPDVLFHVTFTKNVPNIKKKGLIQFQPSNWIKGPGGSRYNDTAGVFAFDHPEDALNWAGKMGWEFRDTDKDISIIRIDMEDEIWDDDPAEDPFVSNKGRALRSGANIKANRIVDAIRVDDLGKPGDLGISRDEWIAKIASPALLAK